jgi:hypothetical protein
MPLVTETQTVDLASWLTAIWDEDTRRFGGHEEDCDEQFGRPCDCIYGEMLARIAADRRILAECQRILAVDGWEYTDAPELAATTVRLLASPYKGRDGWQEGWDHD